MGRLQLVLFHFDSENGDTDSEFVVDLRNTCTVTGLGDVRTLPSPGGSTVNCSHPFPQSLDLPVAIVGKSSFLPLRMCSLRACHAQQRGWAGTKPPGSCWEDALAHASFSLSDPSAVPEGHPAFSAGPCLAVPVRRQGEATAEPWEV